MAWRTLGDDTEGNQTMVDAWEVLQNLGARFSSNLDAYAAGEIDAHQMPGSPLHVQSLLSSLRLAP